MKDRKRTPKGGVQKGKLSKSATLTGNKYRDGLDVAASPFAHAANEAVNRRTLASDKKTPFNAAMEKAAEHDKLRAAAMRSERRKDNRNQIMGPGKKQGRPTKFDAKKAKDLSRIR